MPKNKPGRPPRADKPSTERVEIRLTKSERRDLDRAAGELTAADWIRDRIERATVARIEVSRDDGAWHWVAYDRSGRPASMAGLDDGPEIERRVLQAAREHGLSVDGATVEIDR